MGIALEWRLNRQCGETGGKNEYAYLNLSPGWKPTTETVKMPHMTNSLTAMFPRIRCPGTSSHIWP
jgi:hypothetical protein